MATRVTRWLRVHANLCLPGPLWTLSTNACAAGDVAAGNASSTEGATAAENAAAEDAAAKDAAAAESKERYTEDTAAPDPKDDGDLRDRGVVATGPVAAGALVAESAPFAYCVSAEFSSGVCHQCMKSADTLKRCGGGCKWAHFCSTACQRANWAVHRHECKGLAKILPHRPVEHGLE